MAAKEAEHQQVANAQGRAVAADAADAAWRWQAGAEAKCCGCCLVGGRLGQTLMHKCHCLTKTHLEHSNPLAPAKRNIH
jgi:hypothetical protein